MHRLIKAGVNSSFFIHKQYIPKTKIKKNEEIDQTKCVRACASHKSLNKCELPISIITGRKQPPNSAMLVKTFVVVNFNFSPDFTVTFYSHFVTNLVVSISGIFFCAPVGVPTYK